MIDDAVLAFGHDPGVRIQLRSGASDRSISWTDPIQRALRLRPVDPSDGRSADLTVCICTADDGLAPSGSVVATDERGTLHRSADAWHWVRAGHQLRVPRDGTTADLILPADAAPDTMALRLVDGLRHALLVLLPRIGRFGIHAAGVVVGPGEDAVVLCGPSGCGKSTLTVGLLERGARLLSDDVVVLRPSRSDTEEGQLHGLTRRIRLTEEGWEQSSFADEDRAGDAPDAYKHTIRDEALGPDARADAGTPRLLVFPTITDRATSRLVPVEAPTALRRLLEQMHPPAVLPRAVARTQFDAAAGLVQQSTCHVLEAGRDLYDDPARIHDLLDDVYHRPAVRA